MSDLKKRKRNQNQKLVVRYLPIAKLFLKKFPVGSLFTNEDFTEWLQGIFEQFAEVLRVPFPQGTPKRTNDTVKWVGHRQHLRLFYDAFCDVTLLLDFTIKPVLGDPKSGIRKVRTCMEWALLNQLASQQAKFRKGKMEYSDSVFKAIAILPNYTDADRDAAEDMQDSIIALNEHSLVCEKQNQRLVERRIRRYLRVLPAPERLRLGFSE